MIYELGTGGFVISNRGGWLPGVYATRAAARYAFQFSDEDLSALNDERNAAPEDRPISTADLREYRRRKETAVAQGGVHYPECPQGCCS